MKQGCLNKLETALKAQRENAALNAEIAYLTLAARMNTLTAWADCLNDVADELERANKSLPSYYREMLVRGHPAYLGAHHSDSFLMSKLVRERRYRPEQSAARRHFYRAFQGLSASEIQDAAARGW